MMKSRLDRIEARLKAFFEKSARLTPQDQRQLQLAEQLVSAMRNAMEEAPGDGFSAPGCYLITMHPDVLAVWKEDPDLENALNHALHEAALESGVRFRTPLVIRMVSDALLSTSEIQVSVDNQDETLERTAAIPLDQTGLSHEDPLLVNAFLILEGKRVMPLTGTIVNLGRMLDNQIPLDDPRVSRRHAQLRLMQSHYVLFDLNSTGGTYVNGQRIQQVTLKPGDVISLAGVPLIYGEDRGPSSPIDQTGVILPSLEDEQASPENGREP
jgi:hypothetical protein